LPQKGTKSLATKRHKKHKTEKERVLLSFEAPLL
jgi:hypothetical protein